MANRTWWRLFGRGLVSPVDDMHTANAPSHPELLDLLARRFAASGFDHKFLARAIVSSRAYQRTSRPGASDKQVALFGRMSVKVLSAGQLYDSFVAILGAPQRKKGGGPRTDPPRRVRQFFSDDGDPDPTAYRRGIPHLLRQMNADQFAGRNVADLGARLAKSGRSAERRGRGPVPDDPVAAPHGRRAEAVPRPRNPGRVSRNGQPGNSPGRC